MQPEKGQNMMTREQRIAYMRRWRKKNPHYGRDFMRTSRHTPPSRYLGPRKKRSRYMAGWNNLFKAVRA